MTDATDKLDRLATLHEKGLISREEFEQQKQLILSGPADPAGSDPYLGKEIGAYRILELIGGGGMGTVYRGRHRSATFAERQGGDVAVKVMHPQYARDAHLRERFEREAELGARIDHRNIARVHDLVVDGGALALVMDLVEGQPLDQLIGIKVGPIPWQNASPWFNQLLDAVEVLHAAGVIHRDIKPDNVIVTPDGVLRLIDLGIAKDIQRSRTRTGTGMGTVEYMAPEQYTDAKNIDARADIYSLGMVLHEMIAGRMPWEEDTPDFEILRMKAEGEIPTQEYFPRDTPAPVMRAIFGALECDPDARFGRVGEVRGTLVSVSPSSHIPALADSKRSPENPSSIGSPAELNHKTTPKPGRMLESQSSPVGSDASTANLVPYLLAVVGVLCIGTIFYFLITGSGGARQEAELYEKQATLAQMDVEACTVSKAVDTAESWREYVTKYPSGSCSELARDSIEREKLADDEARACDEAEASDSIASWEKYLKAYPSGTCADKAEERRASLLEDESDCQALRRSRVEIGAIVKYLMEHPEGVCKDRATSHLHRHGCVSDVTGDAKQRARADSVGDCSGILSGYADEVTADEGYVSPYSSSVQRKMKKSGLEFKHVTCDYIMYNYLCFESCCVFESAPHVCT